MPPGAGAPGAHADKCGIVRSALTSGAQKEYNKRNGNTAPAAHRGIMSSERSDRYMANIGEDLKRVLMAGIGAAVLTAEKSKELVEKLVEKGELTAAQGRELVDKLVEKGMMTAEQGKVLAAKLADAAEGAARKSKEMFDKLVAKGEESVRQGRERSEELKRAMEEKKKEKMLADILNSLDQLDTEAREAVKRKLAEMQAGASPEADAAAEKEEKA